MQERRKQVIQESKFLGGDMQHTHLVKGLDYVLLDKVGDSSLTTSTILRCPLYIRSVVRCNINSLKKRS